MDKKKITFDGIIAWLLDVPPWEHYEEWLFNPKNKAAVAEFKTYIKENASYVKRYSGKSE